MRVISRLVFRARAMAAVGVVLAISQAARAAEEPEFSRTTIDLGVVVSDVKKAVDFYTAAVGFNETKGFSVSADFCADVGLTDSKPLDIHVLVLGSGEGATKLKLMEVPGTKSKKSNNDYIHSQLGFRYLTIFVNDIGAAEARLKKAGVQSIAKTPKRLPKALSDDLHLIIVRDPDGNLVELLGPRKSRPREPRSTAKPKTAKPKKEK